MATHRPPPDDFIPWIDRLLVRWRNRRIQRKFHKQIAKTNGFEMYRRLSDYGPQDEQ